MRRWWRWFWHSNETTFEWIVRKIGEATRR
jgi:hypothetical protein